MKRKEVSGSCTTNCSYYQSKADAVKDSDYETPKPWRYVTTSQLIEDTKKLIPQLPTKIGGIVGIPRSGMLPATALATWLHVPLFQMSSNKIVTLGSGARGNSLRQDSSAPLVIVDDTMYTGRSMQRVQDRTRNALYASVYVRPGQGELVDFYGAELPSPHLLEWNLFNNGIFAGHCANPHLRTGFGSDFDGVFCYDCTRDGDDTPEGDARYEQWLITARLKWVPRMFPARIVVTARLERYRAQTLAWCQKWGIRIDRLVMHPATTFAERNDSDVAAWKAEVLRESDVCGFVESHDCPAASIHEYWKKPVISLESGRVFQ